MIMMNFHSVGTKVVTVTMSALLIISGIFLVSYYQTAKKNIITQEIHNSNELLQLAEAVRENTVEKWRNGILSPALIKDITQTGTEAEKRAKILSAVPIANAWNSLKSIASANNFRFKATRIGARNPQNEADAIEQKALEFFNSAPEKLDYFYVDDEKQEIRVFRSVKLEQQCEICHGNPSTSEQIWGNTEGKDILGYPMENKRAGDLHGAFELITPLAKPYQTLHEDLLKALGLLLITLFTIGFICYYFMGRIVIQPLTELALKLQEIAGGQGNLQSRLKVEGKSEFAWIAGSFNGFVKKISKIVSEINTTSDNLVEASENLSLITRAAETGVDKQQSETTQVATAMEEMTATVQEVARNAFRASDAAASADSEALASKNIINDAVRGINVLATEVENAAQVIKELESDSNSIGEVLSVIQGIAEQTNLLALNAAIEAARAGEQGRGFAVVADEVRTLASRTQNSTLEIQKTIERLQSRAEQAVKVMENGKVQATASVQQAASSGAAISNISQKIDTISDMNNQIASAAEEQTAVAEEINRNISNINHVANSTLAGVRKSATACQELLELANQLKRSISQFKN